MKNYCHHSVVCEAVQNNGIRFFLQKLIFAKGKLKMVFQFALIMIFFQIRKSKLLGINEKTHKTLVANVW